MFERSLQDLIKGIRNHKRDSSAYISRAIVEIKKELKSTDHHVKCVAVQKVTYLQMMVGIDLGFSAFHIVEVMSAPRFAHRRVGMLAAAQVFNRQTDVLLLTTNLLKKALHEPNMYEAGVALNCLSNIATKELARDLLEDVARMLGSSRPFVRKKAVLTLYKLYLVYPQGLSQTFARLRQRLDDTEMSVVSCTVNVICELSRKNPRNFVALAPQLFHLLTNSNNNWMLIKIVKLMSALLPEEPRLARKLLEPLSKVVESTQAKSLLYECIHAITQALPYTPREDGSQPKSVPRIVELCAGKLREFVEDPDQNLKFLGLVGFVNLMRSHPRVVSEHKDMVLTCLLDDDVTVKLRALELLTGMVSKRNLMDIVQKLMEHVKTAEGAYREELIGKILYVCVRDRYAYLTNFKWFVSVLVELCYINGAPKGREISEQLTQVVVRVPGVREFAVETLCDVLLEGRLASRCTGAGAMNICHILSSACWITCEYALLLLAKRPREQFLELIDVLLGPNTTDLAAFVQAAYVYNVLKFLVAMVQYDLDHGETEANMLSLFQKVGDKIEPYTHSEHIMVQSRAITAVRVLSQANVYDGNHDRSGEETAPDATCDLLFGEDKPAEPIGNPVSSGPDFKSTIEAMTNGLFQLFAEELPPVAANGQSLVPVPEGLDLEEPVYKEKSQAINEQFDIEVRKSDGPLRVKFTIETLPVQSALESQGGNDSDYTDDDEEDLMLLSSSKKKKAKKSKKAKRSRREDPFYLSSMGPSSHDTSSPASAQMNGLDHDDGETPPMIGLSDDDPVASTISSFSRMHSMVQSEEPSAAVLVADVLPKGAGSSARKKTRPKSIDDSELTLADINLGDEELMDAVNHSSPRRSASEALVDAPEKKHKKKHKKNKKNKKKAESRSNGNSGGDLLGIVLQ